MARVSQASVSRPRRRLPRAVREQQMIDAAVQVFSRRGYHAASMDDISEVAHISKPMIYAYLGSKEELFTACIRREAGRLAESIAGAAQRGISPDEQLWRGLLAFFAFVAEHRDGWIVLYRQARVQGGSFAEEVAAIRNRMVVLVAGLVAAAVPAEQAASASESTPIAHALVGAAEALAEWGLGNPHVSPEAQATRLMNVVWVGLADLVRGEHWRRQAKADTP